MTKSLQTISSVAQQQHELGLEKAAPLRYAAFSSRLCCVEKRLHMYEQWKKAVVHLECATDSEHFYDRIKRVDQLREKLERGEITQEDFGQELAGRTRDLRYHGTALFICKRQTNPSGNGFRDEL